MSVLMEQDTSTWLNRFNSTALGHLLVLVPSARTKTCSPGAVFVIPVENHINLQLALILANTRSLQEAK
jgi:hypothetical protein